MKKSKVWNLLLIAVVALPLMVSCSKDDDGSTGGSSGTNTNGNTNPNPPVADIHVVVNEDGTTSNGSLFSAIDDKNFYIDYIKYTVEEGHLVVSGYDKTGFKGVANIVSSIKYKWNTYEVTKISGEKHDNNAFMNCKNLTSVSIPNSVTYIGDNSFYGCSGLTSVSIPNSVISIGIYAFGDCSSLTSVTIGSSVASIRGYAFYGCSGLTSITIPSSVTSIGDQAFSGCSGLTSITIPASVTSIGNFVFSGCNGLTSIKVESGNTIYDSREDCNAIIKMATNTLLKGCNKTKIPNGVTTIESHAFYGCTGLHSITIPGSVTSIGAYAFKNCSGLTSVTIGNSVTSIGEYAFASCSGLTSVTIGNSVTSTGDRVFDGCSGLTSIHCLGTTPPNIRYSSFSDDIYRTATLYVPSGSYSAYKNDYFWLNFNNIVEE